LVEEHEQAAKEIEVFLFLVFEYPAVAKSLENEADAVHLAIGAGGTAEGPAKTVLTDEVRHHLEICLGVGAEGGELAVAHAAVGVELEGGADEHEGHHAVEIEVAAEALGGVVEEAGGTGVVDAIHHALD